MRKNKYPSPIAPFLLLLITVGVTTRQTEPWTGDQLLAPKDLAAVINSSNDLKPLIISIGPAGLIKDAVYIGPVSKQENLNALKQLISKEKKGKAIVIYCGCCPFKNCPNIRPAFTLLNTMKFTNHKLLDLQHNLKVDWIDQGYPMKSRAD